MSDIDKIRAWHEANARPTVGFGPRRMFDDIAVLLDYIAVQKAENAQLREAAFAYLSVSTFPDWSAGNCRLCDEYEGMHASDCKYGKAQIVLWAAIKKGGTR